MKKIIHRIFVLLVCCILQQATAQTVSRVWVSDQGNGTYHNPVLHADYSDPDAIRVGDDFYLTASSFADIPGLPILHSKDLVNWTIIGHALQQQAPFAHFAVPQHGNGVWAPSLRYHNGEFYLYYPDPDFGIYLTKAKDAAGPWSAPVLVEAGRGLIDPCPLWDDDGKLYLVHAWAGSRAGIKSIITIKEMNAEGTRVTGPGVLVYDGHEIDPTIEGPKLYKRNGYYYIFAPAGGVTTGWQLVLRSKNIYGPYERKVVMDQGASPTNGPHQGAWVNTQTGEDWFLHFQDKGAYGRILHLQPMQWKNNWPVIGEDRDGDGKGEPVMIYRKPNVGKSWPVQTPADSDEFSAPTPGKQWQWQANAKSTWLFMNPAAGMLRLFSDQLPDSARNLWDAPNVLLQKFPAERFMATMKMHFHPNTKLENEKAGLVVMGYSYAGLALKNTKPGIQLLSTICMDAAKGNTEKEKLLAVIQDPVVYFRVMVEKDAVCRFAYSTDGVHFTDAGVSFKAEQGRWVGAKMGMYCVRNAQTNDSGFADVDWFRVEPVE